MMKFLFVISAFLFFTNCGSTSTEEQEICDSKIEYKKYHVTSRDLSKGYVRVFNEKNMDGVKTIYRLTKNKGRNDFIEIDYDENFKKKSVVVYTKKQHGYIEKKKTLFTSGRSIENEIVVPKLFSYNPEKQDVDSRYIFEPTNEITIKYDVKTTFSGQSFYVFEDQKINCIELKISSKIEVNGKKSTSATNLFYAEGIGLVKAVDIEGKYQIITELVDVIEISEFEKIKKNIN